MNYFELNKSLPKQLHVRLQEDSGATKFYMLVADYGWAEKILFADSQLEDANSIAEIIGEHLDIPVNKAKEV